MPCAIKQLQVRNYHGIIETGIHLPLDARWIFLSGENAFGKTAVLRTLTIGLFGPRDKEMILIDPDSKSEIALEIYNNGKILINHVGTPNVKPFSFNYFAAYGSSRLEIQSDQTKGDIIGKSTKTYSILKTDGVSLSIEREMVLWYLNGDSRYDIVKEILLKLLPHGVDIKVDKEKMEVLYIESEIKKEGGPTFEPIPFQMLAAGNKNIIAMIGDLLIRFYKEYEKDKSKDIHPFDFEGIVIIDELDLHLHPKWLQRLPTLLSGLFPKIQFIAATHSEIALLGAPRDSVFLKVTRTEKQGIQIQRLPIDIKNLLSHHILTSPIFDMEKECIQAANERLADVRTEKSYQEIREMDDVTTKLKAFENSHQDYPVDIFDKE
jgi:predicted ATP-binding protein involved in virulence